MTGTFFFLFLVSCATTPITGRSYFTALTESQENQQGEKAYRELLSKERESSGSFSRQVEAVGRAIAAVAGKPSYAWEFRTLENREPNAFCLPGGKVGVHTGIAPFAENEAGLATILGHEIGHALARHGGQRITEALGVQFGLAILGAAALNDSKNRDTILSALGVGATVGVLLPFSRGHESEADEIGIILMARAGYDPREAPRFWDRFSRATKGGQPGFLSTHPSSGRRRDHLTRLLPRALEEYATASRQMGTGSRLNFP